jgi:hypothetical protein
MKMALRFQSTALFLSVMSRAPVAPQPARTKQTRMQFLNRAYENGGKRISYFDRPQIGNPPAQPITPQTLPKYPRACWTPPTRRSGPQNGFSRIGPTSAPAGPLKPTATGGRARCRIGGTGHGGMAAMMNVADRIPGSLRRFCCLFSFIHLFMGGPEHLPFRVFFTNTTYCRVDFPIVIIHLYPAAWLSGCRSADGVSAAG